MNLDDKEKISVACNLLNERYSAEHNMRERSLNFTIWILGLGIALLWTLTCKTDLIISQQKCFFVFLIAYSGLSLWFLRCIEKGFLNNRKVIIKLESLLGCYQKGFYIKEDTLYPEEYKFDKKQNVTSHFLSLYLLIIALAVFLLVATQNLQLKNCSDKNIVQKKETLHKT